MVRASVEDGGEYRYSSGSLIAQMFGVIDKDRLPTTRPFTFCHTPFSIHFQNASAGEYPDSHLP